MHIYIHIYIYTYIYVYIYIYMTLLNFIKMDTWICQNLLQNRAQNGPKSFKIDLWGVSWSTLGTLLAPKWRRSETKSSKSQKI